MLLIPKINNIKNKRLKLGLSKHKLSIKSGLGGSAIYRIESGVSKKIHKLRAQAIAKTLNCEIDELFE